MIGGVDEAGRGPVLGPLVIAGVVVEDDASLKELDVRDSKQVSPKKRCLLARQIKKIVAKYEIIRISASDIDDMRKVMTLNEIEVSAFRRVIEKLKPDMCYVDAADVNEKRFGRDILSQLSFQLEIVSRHNADRLYPVVAAASILAKTTRDELVEEIATELRKKLDLPLGSGYPADPITQTFLKTWIKKYGKAPPYVRHSWKTAQKLLAENKMKTLDKF